MNKKKDVCFTRDIAGRICDIVLLICVNIAHATDLLTKGKKRCYIHLYIHVGANSSKPYLKKKLCWHKFYKIMIIV